jgi:hypothetical protein
LFFKALNTMEFLESRHYSQIRYRFSDGIETTYRMGENPTSIHTQKSINRTLSTNTTFSCKERQGLYVRSKDCISETSQIVASTVRINTFKLLIQTELSEHWTFTTRLAVYHLTKVARARTKHLASRAVPTFDLSIQSETPTVVYDLFGRFDENGREVSLTIIPDPIAPNGNKQ